MQDNTSTGNSHEMELILRRLEDLIIANRELTLQLESQDNTSEDECPDKDHLTGAYSVAYFEKLSKIFAAEDSKPVAVITADINGLHKVNGIYGFEGGNKAIVRAYEKIKGTCRENRYIVRVSGGLFCILLTHTDLKSIREICSNICAGCGRENKRITGGAFNLNMSAGCYISDDPVETFAEAFSIAETRMNRRKLLEADSVRSSIVSSVISTLNERYDDTHENINRMIKLCLATGDALRFDYHQLDELELSCVLHDLGKIAIRETIINKNAKLTKEEKKEIQLHPLIGSRIIRSVPEFSHVADHILSHHEKWDGTGYPRRLKGEEITLIARIIALADAYDSMTSGRPYREPLPLEYVVNEIRSCGGTQFDPVLAQIFADLIMKDQLL